MEVKHISDLYFKVGLTENLFIFNRSQIGRPDPTTVHRHVEVATVAQSVGK